MNLIAWIIVACEIAFWVVIGAGLVVRYVFKRKKAGLFLLALVPVVDIVLLLVTGIDLYRGATATAAHAIAAVYLGVSIAFGKSMIQWADVHFQYYITKQGPKPTKKYGKAYGLHQIKSWLKHLFAYIIGASMLVLFIFFIDDPSRTEAMKSTLQFWSLVLVIDLVISISDLIWPRREKVL